MKRLTLGLAIALSLGVMPVVYGADADIETLQSQVIDTKSQTDSNAAKIKTLEGGLPAERAAREAADSLLQNQINDLALTQGPPGPPGPPGNSNVHYLIVQLVGDAPEVAARILGPGIDCVIVGGLQSGDCSEVFPLDYIISLQPLPEPDTTFSGWQSGSCTGTGDCALLMDRDIVVTAHFNKPVDPPFSFEVAYAEIRQPCTPSPEQKPSGTTITVYGAVFAPGLTDLTAAPDPSTWLVAQAGIGPRGSRPDLDPDQWQWISAAAVNGLVDMDEYAATLTVPAVGAYDMAFRFAKSGEGAYLYGDCNGSSDGYSPTNASQLDVY